jgi:hypothetical protein
VFFLWSWWAWFALPQQQIREREKGSGGTDGGTSLWCLSPTDNSIWPMERLFQNKQHWDAQRFLVEMFKLQFFKSVHLLMDESQGWQSWSSTAPCGLSVSWLHRFENLCF